MTSLLPNQREEFCKPADLCYYGVKIWGSLRNWWKTFGGSYVLFSNTHSFTHLLIIIRSLNNSLTFALTPLCTPGCLLCLASIREHSCRWWLTCLMTNDHSGKTFEAKLSLLRWCWDSHTSWRSFQWRWRETTNIASAAPSNPLCQITTSEAQCHVHLSPLSFRVSVYCRRIDFQKHRTFLYK